MNTDALQKLERLNRLLLTDEQREAVLGFFAARQKELELLEGIDTSNIERMVQVMPLETVVREDVEKKLFTRDELQRGAPETADGYWKVPRLVE